ncbi:DUF2570 family protein [Serratia odorifera]|uniref:DUF2570 family protein n=1 Tax=Serratia odorifera TaxID=618 RepID=UPI003D2904EC
MNRYWILSSIFVACLAGGLIWSANHYHGKYKAAQQLVDEQKKTLAQQTGVITTLRADDARNRALMAEQQRREQQLRHQADINQRKLRDALKNDECANRAMPNAALKLLLPDTKSGSVSGGAVTP